LTPSLLRWPEPEQALNQVHLWAARWRRIIRAWSGPLAELLASGSAMPAALQRDKVTPGSGAAPG